MLVSTQLTYPHTLICHWLYEFRPESVHEPNVIQVNLNLLAEDDVLLQLILDLSLLLPKDPFKHYPPNYNHTFH